MVSIVNSRQEILLSPTGSNVWSGQFVQSLNSQAVTWSLAKQVYGPEGPYFIVPFGVLIGIIPTVIHYLISQVRVLVHPLCPVRKFRLMFCIQRSKTILGIKTESILLPIIYRVRTLHDIGTPAVES